MQWPCFEGGVLGSAQLLFVGGFPPPCPFLGYLLHTRGLLNTNCGTEVAVQDAILRRLSLPEKLR